MTWIKGGPFLEISFLHILVEERTQLVVNLLEKLGSSINHLEITLNQNELEKAISEFDKGYPYDEEDDNSYLIHSLRIHIYLNIEGRRKSILSFEQLSDNLIAIDFWFFGSQWDAKEWGQIGITENQLKGFEDFLIELFMLINFPIGMIEIERDIAFVFDTDEGWPHDSYNLKNIKSQLINDHMITIVKNDFIKQSRLNIKDLDIVNEIEGGQIIKKK